MRILCVASYYKPAYVYGGPVKSVSTMLEGLVRQGADVTVLTTNANGVRPLDVALGEPVDVSGVTVFYYPVAAGWPRSFFYSPDLANVCADVISGNDLVVLESFYSHSMGPSVSACLRGGIPYVIPPRGQLLPWALRQKRVKKGIYMTLLGRHYLNCAAGLQCSDPVELQALRTLKLKAPGFVIPNALDTTAWANLPARGSLRRKLQIADRDPILLMLGRLHRVKNPELAVEMMSLLRRTDVHLVFVGPDEQGYQASLRSRALALGFASRLHFTSLLTGAALLQAMADATVFIMPSVMESFGMAAVEAMSAGLPVILSEHVPLGRWVEAAGAGLQVECTPNSFAFAVSELLADPKRLSEMGRRARGLAQDRFDIAKVAPQMLAQYESLVFARKPISDD